MKALSIKNLKKTYKGGLDALKGIDLDVEEGDFFALLGPNGAGKSTAINIISSLVTKSSGKVEILGIDIDQNHSLAKKELGVVGQEVNFNQFEKVSNIVINQAGYFGLSRKKAKENGNRIENGIFMFIYQANQSFSIWNNIIPKIDEEVLKILE